MRIYQSTPTPNRLSFSFDVERVRKLLAICAKQAEAGDREAESFREMFDHRLLSHELQNTVPSEEAAQ